MGEGVVKTATLAKINYGTNTTITTPGAPNAGRTASFYSPTINSWAFHLAPRAELVACVVETDPALVRMAAWDMGHAMSRHSSVTARGT